MNITDEMVEAALHAWFHKSSDNYKGATAHRDDMRAALEAALAVAEGIKPAADALYAANEKHTMRQIAREEIDDLIHALNWQSSGITARNLDRLRRKRDHE